MKRISNWMIPPFLRRFDTFLLENHPVVWRTRIHFVLFYSILAAVLLFVSGYFYAAPSINFIVDPIKPVDLTVEQDFPFFVALSIIGIIFWSYNQYLFEQFNESLPDIFIRFSLYAIGIFFIAVVGTSSFHFGKIIQVGYDVMSFDEIQEDKEDHYSISDKRIEDLNTEQNYSSSEKKKIIWNSKLQEDTILFNRYNSDFFDQLFDRLTDIRLIDSFQLKNISYHRGDVPINILSTQEYLSDLSSLLYISRLTDSIEIKNVVNSYLISDKTPLLDTLRISYDTIFRNDQQNKQFLYSTASEKLDETLLIVDNARLYVQEFYLFKHLRNILLLIPLITSLFLIMLYLKGTRSFVALMSTIIFFYLVYITGETTFVRKNFPNEKNLEILLLGVTTILCILLLIYKVWYRNADFLSFLLHFIFFVSLVFLFALVVELWDENIGIITLLSSYTISSFLSLSIIYLWKLPKKY